MEQLVDQDVRRHLLEHAAVCVDEADVAASRDSEVRVTRLAGAVDGATEYRDLEVLRIGGEPLLHRLSECLHPDVVATARGARDHDRAALAQAERLEDLECGADLLDRI